jgi:hypothetical protein
MPLICFSVASYFSLSWLVPFVQYSDQNRFHIWNEMLVFAALVIWHVKSSVLLIYQVTSTRNENTRENNTSEFRFIVKFPRILLPTESAFLLSTCLY